MTEHECKNCGCSGETIHTTCEEHQDWHGTSEKVPQPQQGKKTLCYVYRDAVGHGQYELIFIPEDRGSDWPLIINHSKFLGRFNFSNAFLKELHRHSEGFYCTGCELEPKAIESCLATIQVMLADNSFCSIECIREKNHDGKHEFRISPELMMKAIRPTLNTVILSSS